MFLDNECGIKDVKSMKGWNEFDNGENEEFGDYFKPGDLVTEDVYDYFLDILPPVSFSKDYLQAGGAIMTAFNRKTKRHESTYMTFISTPTKGIYKFCGYCFVGEKEDVRYESVNDFLKKTYADGVGLCNRRSAIVCKDGFKFSVQAGSFYECVPKLDGKDVEYISCEVGFPTKEEELLMPYREGWHDEPTESIYPYTPISVIEAVIKKHGGYLI
jgi:hypothetical protein